MTTRDAPQCLACRHFRSPLDNPTATSRRTCAAFPAEIPMDIWENALDHRLPVSGDNGIRWTSNGESFPEWAVDLRRAV